MFHFAFEIDPIVRISSEEHVEYRWTTSSEAMKMPLISGGLEVLHHYKSMSR
jgi:hypothetical protein